MGSGIPDHILRVRQRHLAIERFAVIIDDAAMSVSCSVKKLVITSIVLMSLLASSANAQNQESPKGNMHRDFPKVQLIIPSIPPWHFNFDLDRWERNESPQQLLELPLAHTDIEPLLLTLPARKLRHKRTPHHMHRKSPRR